MMRGNVLYRSALVSLIRYDHPPDHPHRDPLEEVSSAHTVSFIEHEGFDLHHGRNRWWMNASRVFVTCPGLTYRCGHDEPNPRDVSLSVQIAPALVEDVQAAAGTGWTRSVPTAAMTNRLAYLRHRLIETAGNGDAAMAMPALAGELLAAVDRGGPTPTRLFRAGQLAWYARRVDAAREMLSEKFVEPHSLESTARDAGMSPFHFSRIFRELAGLPPHRYLLKVRLERAAQQLAQGSGVTEACFASGFNNLGHFIRSFRRAYGLPPSRYRALRSRGDRAE